MRQQRPPRMSCHADGDAARGETRFKDCAACHHLEAGSNNVGPSLHEIFQRKAGALSDFRYSPAMKRSGITWTPETLDKFITDPQGMVIHCLRQRIAETRTPDIKRIAEFRQRLTDTAGRRVLLVQDEKNGFQHGDSAHYRAR